MPKPAAEYTRDAFLLMCSKIQDYTTYKGIVGTLPAQILCHAMFDMEARRSDGQGFWQNNGTVNEHARVSPTATIKFKKTADKTTFEANIKTLIFSDGAQIQIKQGQVSTFMAKARSGELRTSLNNAVMPEATYYTAPPPSVPAPGAPPIPARPAWIVNRAKAKAWLKRGVIGDTRAFDEVVDQYARQDGTWPLGTDQKIMETIWKRLVTDAPPYRAPSLARPYPSSVGGMHVLKTFIPAVARENLPAQGNTAWENWALFVFGATMRSQPFPDGNKRASRAAYAIIMATAGIPFRAPTDALGGQLASM